MKPLIISLLFLAPSAWAGSGLPAHVDLTTIHKECSRTKTDALIIIKNGDVIVEDYFGKEPKALPTMSITKSIVSLAIGMLVDEGKIRSLDEPVWKWIPELNNGQKAKITLRHIMTQTSGLEHQEGSSQMESQGDELKFAINSKSLTEPGDEFSYSNEATMLLSQVIKRASGMGADEYLKRKLFEPLDISGWIWKPDRAGNIRTYGYLLLKPRDLAKIGQMLLNGGRWNGRGIVSEKWIEMSTMPSHRNRDYGLLWWLIRFTKKEYGREDDIYSGYYGNGWLGQYLVVLPQDQVVAVRMRKGTAGSGRFENEHYSFLNFPGWIARWASN